MAKSRRRVGVDPFTEDEDLEDLELVELDDEQLEEKMAKETAKAKARRAREVEAEADDDDDDDEDEVEDPEAEEDTDTEDDEDDEDEDEEDESDPDAFIPWIVHEDQDWELQEALDTVSTGDPIIVYDLKNNRWYKLAPIKVGELPAQVAEA